MSLLTSAARTIVALVSVGSLIAACSDDPPPPPSENAGSACTAASQCYTNLDGGTVKGEILCLAKVTGGYCTHKCASDADCCAVPGECRNTAAQVCAPFADDPTLMCFVSCEDADIQKVDAAFVGKGTDYCHKYANTGLGCRATGGGNPKKVCASAG
jgi:hypothetical protein